MTLPQTFAEDVIDQPARVQLEVFLDEHRTALRAALDGLTEQEARRSLVPSATTLLGLVKHATFVEKVWFDEAVTCRSRAEIGIPATPDESFVLDDGDTVASVQQAHREACEASRRATAPPGARRRRARATAAVRCRCAGSTSTCCASSPSTAGMPTSCASRCSRPDPRSRTSGRRPAAVSRSVPHRVRLQRRGDPVVALQGGHHGNHVEGPGPGVLRRAEQLAGHVEQRARRTGRASRLGDEPGVGVDVPDGGLRVEVPREELGQLQGRDGARHRTRVQDLLEGGEVEVQGGREVVGLREPGDHGAEVEVHRELGAEAGGHGSAAHDRTAHRPQERCDLLDRLVGAGDETHELATLRGHAGARHGRLDIASAGGHDVALDAGRERR